jgi:MSHA biogenesis protein MshL
VNHLATLLLPILCGLPLAAQQAQGIESTRRVSLSVRDADLKDLLRAAAEDTNYNLSFEADIETRIKGLDLKGVTLQEILDQVLPNLGLGYVKTGRTIHIQKSEGGLRFFQVDHLAMRRMGSKSFMVNASGQLIQSTSGGSGSGSGSGGGGTSGGSGGGSGGGDESGSSSAYTSSLNTGNGFDPWDELRSGLTTLIFGEAMESPETNSDSGETVKGPTSLAYSRNGKTLMIHPDSGLVVVGADPGTHKRVDSYLQELRRRNRRQVLLEARIVEVTLGNDSQIGVDWNGLLSKGGASGGSGTDIRGTFATGGTNNSSVDASTEGLAKLVVQNARISATLSALAREGRLQVLSAPRISTLNNQKAILRVVREEAFFLQTSQTTGTGGAGGFSTTVNITPMVVPVGIVLDILPQISDDNSVTLSVNPSISEIVTVRSLVIQGVGNSGGASATLPVVDRRDLDAVVRLRSGETLVLAGIIRTKEGVDDRGVPWLRKVPFLGNFFTKKEKTKLHTELAIFITPTLVEDSEQIATQRDTSEKRLEKAGADLKPEPKPTSTIKEP